jgi:hypothetical protein
MELKGLGIPTEPVGCACCVGGGVNPRNSGGQGAGLDLARASSGPYFYPRRGRASIFETSFQTLATSGVLALSMAS